MHLDGIDTLSLNSENLAIISPLNFNIIETWYESYNIIINITRQ